MENYKYLKFLTPVFIFGFFIVSFSNVFAYNIETHAFLTNEIIEFYNQNFSNQRITDNLKDYLIDGARREDDPVRWMNHFFDPIYDRGLTNSILGTWQKSKEWARDSKNQNESKYSSVIATILSSWQSKKIQEYFPTSDFTWQEAIRYWINGDKEMAMFALGHILHLMEDASVPDHTRNDPHPNDSPYEIYTSQFTINNADENLNKRLNDESPVVLSDLDSYFDKLANYSNNNFYSKDKIGIQSGYKLPEPEFYPKKINGLYFAFTKDVSNDEYLLFLVKKYKDGDDLLSLPSSDISLDDPQRLVLQNYWFRLSTKSVQYGAGVIDLFFQEVEKEKNNPNFVKAKEKSFFGQLIDSTQSLFAQIGGFFSNSSDNNQDFQLTDEISLNQTENQNNVLPVSVSPSQNTDQIQNANQTQNAEQSEQNIGQSENIQTQNSRQQLVIQLQNQLNDIKNQAESINQQIGLLSSVSANVVNSQANTSSQSAILSSSQIIYGGGGGGGGGGGSSQNNQTILAVEPIIENNLILSTSTTLNTTTTDLANLANNIVISEIQAGTDNNSDDEFVEIYNPTDVSVDLGNWSLKRRISQNSTSTKNLVLNFSATSKIGAKSFFLIAHKDYSGTTTPDLIYSNNSNPLAYKDDIVFLEDGSEAVVDEVYYAEISKGKSLERKANASSTIESMLSGEDRFLGNGYDMDNADDFIFRDNPEPQNSQNLPEPRNAPTTPQNFTAQYSSSTSEIVLSWQESQDYSGANSAITYKINEINSASSSVLMDFTTTSTNANVLILEFGRDYQFEIFAIDKDGLNSSTSSAQIYIETPQNFVLSATSTIEILLSQIDNSASSDSFYKTYQNFGNGISGELKNLEFKMSSSDACQQFSFNEFSDADYTQLSRSFSSRNSDGSVNSDFTVRRADGSVWEQQACASFGGEKIVIEFNNFIADVDKYYQLYSISGDNSRKISFEGSGLDAGFGSFRGCNLANAVSANGWVYTYDDCYTPDFDIYFIINGLPIE